MPSVLSNDKQHDEAARLMVDQNIELKPYQNEINDKEVAEKMLTPKEDLTLNLMNTKLKIYDSVTKALQRENLDLAGARLLFNETLKKLSNFDAKKRYIHENAEIIKFKDFENGCVKIIEQHEDDLTVDEAEACANLLLRE